MGIFRSEPPILCGRSVNQLPGGTPNCYCHGVRLVTLLNQSRDLVPRVVNRRRFEIIRGFFMRRTRKLRVSWIVGGLLAAPVVGAATAESQDQLADIVVVGQKENQELQRA